MWFLFALLSIANPTVVPPLSVRIVFGVAQMQWDGLRLCGKHSMCFAVFSHKEDAIFCVEHNTESPNLRALANRSASDLHSASHSSKALILDMSRPTPSASKSTTEGVSWRGFCLRNANDLMMKIHGFKRKRYLFTKNACFLFSGAASTTGSRPQWHDTFHVWHHSNSTWLRKLRKWWFWDVRCYDYQLWMIHTLAMSSPTVKLRVSDALPVQQHTALAGVSPTPDKQSKMMFKKMTFLFHSTYLLNRVFFYALHSTRALIRRPAFACALELPEKHWETLESKGSQGKSKGFDFVALWNTCPSLEDVQLSRILLLRSDDFSQHGPATEVRTSLCICRHWYSFEIVRISSVQKHRENWMFWISAQRYQNEVSLPWPRCTLHICINVLRQTQSSHVPPQTPKYHTPKTSQKTLEYAFWRLSGLSGSFQCVTIPESWAARNDECQRAPRRRPPASKKFGKQRLIKCLWSLKFLSFKIRKYLRKKQLVLCFHFSELSRSYRSKNRTQSLASSLRLCPVGHQDFLYIPSEKWCSGHCVWKGVMNRSSTLSFHSITIDWL